MTDLNLMGPALRLVHRYLGQADVPDAGKLAFAGELLGLVGDQQAQLKQALRVAMHRTGILVDPATMLQLAAAALVREMMKPDGGDVADWRHRWHNVTATYEIERIFEKFGYWTVAASQARLDMQSARTRAVKVAFEEAAGGAAAHLPDIEAESDIEILEAATRMTKDFEEKKESFQRFTADTWGPEDDRLVVHALVADIIDLMPQDKLERVLEAAKRIRDE